MFALTGAVLAAAPDEVPHDAAGAIRFDIERQPLASALERYGALSGLPVFFDVALVEGRMATAVQGDYPAAAALQKLLEGTGIVAHPAGEGLRPAFVLQPAAPQAARQEAAPREAPQMRQVYRRFDGLVQTRIQEALCTSLIAAPGDFRAAVQFHIDKAGRVHQVRLLDSTGDSVRDAALLSALGELRLDWPPPEGMAQPVTLLIQPRRADRGDPCAGR